MKTHNVIQKSPEWFELRLQYPLTASHAQAIGNQGKGLETLCWEKMAEKHSKGIKEVYTNEHLERGNELESEARAIYELETGNTAVEVGFITNESISQVGGISPDGLVGEDGLVEIKCFADTKHFQMSVKGLTIEGKYQWQMQMQMLFTGRKWCDFVAYNPNFEKALLVERVLPDTEMQNKIIAGLKKGEELLKEIESNLK
jgi:putative phage-type endonuclease